MWKNWKLLSAIRWPFSAEKCISDNFVCKYRGCENLNGILNKYSLPLMSLFLSFSLSLFLSCSQDQTIVKESICSKINRCRNFRSKYNRSSVPLWNVSYPIFQWLCQQNSVETPTDESNTEEYYTEEETFFSLKIRSL